MSARAKAVGIFAMTRIYYIKKWFRGLCVGTATSKSEEENKRSVSVLSWFQAASKFCCVVVSRLLQSFAVSWFFGLLLVVFWAASKFCCVVVSDYFKVFLCCGFRTVPSFCVAVSGCFKVLFFSFCVAALGYFKTVLGCSKVLLCCGPWATPKFCCVVASGLLQSFAVLWSLGCSKVLLCCGLWAASKFCCVVTCGPWTASKFGLLQSLLCCDLWAAPKFCCVVVSGLLQNFAFLGCFRVLRCRDLWTALWSLTCFKVLLCCGFGVYQSFAVSWLAVIFELL